MLENDGVGVGDGLAEADAVADAVGVGLDGGDVDAALFPLDELQPARAAATTASTAMRLTR